MEVEPSPKKFKSDGDATIHHSLIDFGNFKCEKILRDDPTRKILALKAGVKGSSSPAVVVLEKAPFTEGNVKEVMASETSLEKTFHNDVYGNYTGFPKQELNGLKVIIIHPANEKHIKKYSTHESFLVNETPELYSNVLLPHLETSSFNIQWVYNILEHKSESDRIVCEDTDPETGFVLLPDLKWDGTSKGTLYLCAIVHRRDLRSIRDLRAEHLPLLRNIWTKGTEAIADKYGVPAARQRVYFHYQPSYYHLHVHFTSVRFEAPGTHVGKAHLLPEVMSNIELVSDYYARATLAYYVHDGDTLASKLRASGYRLDLETPAEGDGDAPVTKPEGTMAPQTADASAVDAPKSENPSRCVDPAKGENSGDLETR